MSEHNIANQRTQTVQQMRSLVRAALFAALTASGGLASLQIPISTVPFTLQVMFALMSGLVLGAKAGTLSQLVYITLGLIGLPVFAKGGAGFGVLFGPTGGYLIGFVCAAGVTGALGTLVRRITKDTSAWRATGYALAALVGLLSLYIPGTLRLAQVLKTTVSAAAIVGVVPFLLPDLCKAIIAALLAVALERRGLRPS